MSSIFSRIVKGEIPCFRIAENDRFLAFLDVNPIAKGHVLVIPKDEIDNIFEINDTDYQGLFLFAKRVAHALGKCIPCEKVGMAVIGLEVRHAHIHLVPINNIYDIDFKKPKLSFSVDEFRAMAAEISSGIEGFL